MEPLGDAREDDSESGFADMGFKEIGSGDGRELRFNDGSGAEAGDWYVLESGRLMGGARAVGVKLCQKKKK